MDHNKLRGRAIPRDSAADRQALRHHLIAIIDDAADRYQQTKAKHDVVFVARMVKDSKDPRIGNRNGALLEVIDARRHEQSDDKQEQPSPSHHSTVSIPMYVSVAQRGGLIRCHDVVSGGQRNACPTSDNHAEARLGPALAYRGA
jgi:hypothetical protein